MRLPRRTELGEKQAFSFSLAHTHSNCPSPPYTPKLTYCCKSMYHNSCNAPSKCVFFQVLSFQAKILLLWGGSFSAGARDTRVDDSQMDQSWVPSRCSEGQLLTCVDCLFHAVQLNLVEKGILLARKGLFSLGRDWKDALLLSDTKRTTITELVSRWQPHRENKERYASRTFFSLPLTYSNHVRDLQKPEFLMAYDIIILKRTTTKNPKHSNSLQQIFL